MTSKAYALASLFLLAPACGVFAQEMPPPDDDKRAWIESEAPPPPAFDLDRLIPIDVGPSSNLHYGIDPKTILITHQDGLVRYVLVARSNSGTLNVRYDAIRCATGEIKTYAYANSADGGWQRQDNPQWRPIDGRLSASYAQALVNGGMCVGNAIDGPASHMIDALKRGGIPTQQR